MLQKITQISYERRFNGITEYAIGHDYTEEHYLLSLKILKKLFIENSNCLEEEQIKKILQRVQLKADVKKIDPNSYFHYVSEHRLTSENRIEHAYIKIGDIEIFNDLNYKNTHIPIRLKNYFKQGKEYITKLSVGFIYDRKTDILSCKSVAYTEPNDIFRTYISTLEECASLVPVKVKELIKK